MRIVCITILTIKLKENGVWLLIVVWFTSALALSNLAGHFSCPLFADVHEGVMPSHVLAKVASTSTLASSKIATSTQFSWPLYPNNQSMPSLVAVSIGLDQHFHILFMSVPLAQLQKRSLVLLVVAKLTEFAFKLALSNATHLVLSKFTLHE